MVHRTARGAPRYRDDYCCGTPGGEMTAAPMGLDLARVAAALTEAGIELAGPLTLELIAGGRSNLTFRATDGTRRWVLRRRPWAGLTPGAHDVAREYRVTSALWGTGVPVPRPLLLCTDDEVLGAPFTLVDFVDGRTFRTQDELAALGEAEVAAAEAVLIEVLARLHAVVPAQVGLGDFGRPGYLQRQVSLWMRQYALVCAEPARDVERLHAALAARVPDSEQMAVVHGDYRIDNVLLDPIDAGRIAAVVDWELSTLGDPRADLAMTCMYRHPTFDYVVGAPAAATSSRFGTVDTIAALYSDTTGDDLGDWPFYRALAAFKLAVIVEGIHHRAAVGGGDISAPPAVAQAVPDLVAEGLSLLSTPRTRETL